MSHVNFITAALLAALPLIGLIVADDLFGLRIPLQLAIQPNCDVGQMTGRHRAVVGVNIGNRQFAGLHAVDEVLHVRRRFAAIQIGNRVFRQGIAGEIFDRLPGQFPPIDEQFSLCAFEEDAVIEAEVVGSLADVEGRSL